MSHWDELKSQVAVWDLYGPDGNWRGRLRNLEQYTLQEGETVVELQVYLYTMESDQFFDAIVEQIESLKARVAALEP